MQIVKIHLLCRWILLGRFTPYNYIIKFKKKAYFILLLNHNEKRSILKSFYDAFLCNDQVSIFHLIFHQNKKQNPLFCYLYKHYNSSLRAFLWCIFWMNKRDKLPACSNFYFISTYMEWILWGNKKYCTLILIFFWGGGDLLIFFTIFIASFFFLHKTL